MADQNQDLSVILSETTRLVNSANDLVKLIIQENRSNTAMLIAAFREEGLYVRQLLQQHDARLARLENN